jgi:hypothetical protein
LLKLVGDISSKDVPGVVTNPIVTEGIKSVEEVLTSLDYDEVMESKEGFFNFIKEFASAVRAEAVKEIRGVLPGIVPEIVTHQMTYKEMHDQFYDTHKELASVKGYVAQLAKEYSAANPDKSVGEILSEVAKTARINLGLPLEPAVPPPASGERGKPTFPGGTQSSRSNAPRRGAEESEINELISDY